MAGYGTTEKLPCGILYPDAFPDGTVNLVPMGTTEEKFFSAESLRQDVKTNRLIQGCCTNLPKGFDPLGFTIPERFWFMWVLRILSWGPAYRFSFKCTECGEKSNNTVSMKPPDPDAVPDDGSEPIGFPVLLLTPEDADKLTVTIPGEHSNAPVKAGDVLTWRLLTGHDELKIAKYAEQMRRKLKPEIIGDPEYEYRLALRLKTINEAEPTFSDKLHYVQALRGQDLLAYRGAVESIRVGVQLEQEFECQVCGYPNGPMPLPVSRDFFLRRPDQGTDSAAGGVAG